MGLITDSAVDLLEAIRKPEVVAVAATIRQTATTVFHDKFPTLEPLDLGIGLIGGAVASLQNSGVNPGVIADLLRRVATTLEKNPG